MPLPTIKGQQLTRADRVVVNDAIDGGIITGAAVLHLANGGVVHALEIDTIDGARWVYLDRERGVFVDCEVS